MSPNLTLLLVAGTLLATGVYLMMERSLTRVLVGVLLAGNGVNVLFLVASGRAGSAPFVGRNPASTISDPLPQAMVLTAIVITLGLTAFLLTLAYRSFQVHGHDEVADDVEDRQIRRLAKSDRVSASFDESDRRLPSEDGSEPIGEEGRYDTEDERVDPAEEATDAIVGRGEGAR
jgi:multicomponent Na+:H+ antiporter subunit C